MNEALANGVTSAARPTAAVPRIDDLEVVLVSYRSRHHVESLLADWPGTLRVIVVDNSANVDGVAELVEGRVNVRYLSGGGQGFARAANMGAFNSDGPYVVFVNPDCRPTVDQMLSLAAGVARDEGTICHAATPISLHGFIEIGVGGWEPTVPRTMVHACGLHKVFPRSGLYAHPRVGEHVPVDWVTGTCMVVRSGPFRDLGGFDEAFFVYSEDMAFGHRARENGWRMELREDVVVPHGTGSSGAPSSEMRRLQGASFANYMDRYKRPIQAGAIRALYTAGLSWRLVVLTASGRRERAAASRAIVKGVVTRRAFIGGTEVARARVETLSPAR